MAKTKQQSKISPRGKAMWSKVNTTFDDWQGKQKYMINLVLDNPSAFTEELKGYYEEGKKDPKFAGVKFNDRKATFGEKETKEGNIEFVFWTYAFYTDKDGNKIQKTIPVYDNYGKRIDMTEIGNGSIVEIAYKPSTFKHETGNVGVTLILDQIVVRELVKFERNDTPAFSFDEFTPPTDDSFPDDEPEI